MNINKLEWILGLTLAMSVAVNVLYYNIYKGGDKFKDDIQGIYQKMMCDWNGAAAKLPDCAKESEEFINRFKDISKDIIKLRKTLYE